MAQSVVQRFCGRVRPWGRGLRTSDVEETAMFRLSLVVTAMLTLTPAVPQLVLAAAPPAELCGSWEHRAPGNLPSLTMTLRADGSGTLGDEPIRFSVQGAQLIVVIDEQR